MKIAVVTDKSRISFIPSEEAQKEDEQKQITVRQIQEVLSKKYDCISLMADDNIINTLKEEEVDLVFNLCNGLVGDSKLAQFPAMLEFAEIPYTASSVLGHTLASNKFHSSSIFETSGIDTPKFKAIYDLSDLEGLDISFPVIIKPNDEGSSRGIYQDSLVFNQEDLKAKLSEDLKIYNPPILINEYIDGKEFSIGVIGNGEATKALAIQEIDLSGLPEDMLQFYSFEVKTYYKSHTQYFIPARLSEEQAKLVETSAIRAYNSLGLQDYARVDIILKDDTAYVLEINSLPGLMKDKSSLFRMAEATGLGYDNLIFDIVDRAKERYNL